MDREDHLNNLNKKLNSNNILIEDIDGLWDELEPRLPQKRKNRFFYLWISGIAVVGIVLLGYLSHEFIQREGSASQKSQASTLTPHTETENHSVTTHNSHDILESVNIEENHNSAPAPSPALASEIAVEKKEINPTTLLSNSQRASEERISADQSTYGRSVAETLEKTKFSSKENNITNPQNKPNHSNTDLALIPAAPEMNVQIPRPATLSWQIENLNIDDRETISATHLSLQLNDNKVASVLWSIGISNYLLGNLHSKLQSNSSPLGTKISDLTSGHLGYTLGTEVVVRHTSGFSLGLGLERVNLSEKFRLDNSVETKENIVNQQAFSFQSTFIAAEQEILRTTRQDVLNYNAYNFTNILPSIGFDFTNNVTFGFSLAPIIQLQQKFDGLLVDEDELLTRDTEAYFEPSSVKFGGLLFKNKLSKKVFGNASLGIRSQIRYLNTITAESNTDFTTQFIAFGVGIDFTYKIR